MENEGRVLHIIRRSTESKGDCDHDWATYPAVGGADIRIVKCRKCKLEAMTTPE